MKLISMKDFVQKKRCTTISTTDIVKVLTEIFKYEMFIQLCLEIWMFVPAKLINGEWVVLQEPRREYYDSMTGWNCPEDAENYESKLSEYREAEERVLFKGVEYVEAKHKNSFSIVRICKSLSQINYPAFWGGLTIEDLIKYNLELTESGAKQAGFI